MVSLKRPVVRFPIRQERLLSKYAICLSVVLISCSHEPVARLLDTAIVSDNKYIYLSTPWVDFSRRDRLQALLEAKKIIIEALRRQFPNNYVTESIVNSLKATNSEELAHILKMTERWINNHQDRLNQFGFRPQDFIPSAAIISFGGGGKLDFANDKIPENSGKNIAKQGRPNRRVAGRGAVAMGGLGLLRNGGSFTVGIVIVPMKVIKIHKITKEVEESWYRFKMSVVGIPDVNLIVQGNKRGRAGLRLGIGLVFGELQDPEDFGGFSIGYSFNYKYGTTELVQRVDKEGQSLLGFYDNDNVWHERKGHGLNIKVAALMRNLSASFQNVYIIASYRLGLQQGSDHEYNAGPVLKLNRLLELLTGQDLSDIDNDKDVSTK